MQTLMTLLTACSLSIHALIGCCWSHAHTCAADATEVAVCCHSDDASQACALSAERACCHHEGNAGTYAVAINGPAVDDCCGNSCGNDHSTSPHPCDCRVDCHGFCTFLPPEKTSLENLADAAVWDLVPCALESDLLTISIAGPNGWLVDPGEIASPLRRHLLHQVLRI